MLSDLSGVMHSKITRGGGNDCKRWISHQIQNLIYHTKSENANIYDPPSLLFCFRGCAYSTFSYHDWIFMTAKSLEYVWRHNVIESSKNKSSMFIILLLPRGEALTSPVYDKGSTSPASANVRMYIYIYQAPVIYSFLILILLLPSLSHDS